jgi:D-alanyl-D-alanine-carboxypeptidase/D-alanyl-D-alanine-endopeptidase
LREQDEGGEFSYRQSCCSDADAADATVPSTATDMLCLLRANLDPAHTPLAAQIERTQLPRLRSAKRVEVGLGWQIARPPGAAGPVLWHNGGTSGFRSFVGVARESGAAVVVLSNTARSVDRLGLRLLKALPSAAG